MALSTVSSLNSLFNDIIEDTLFVARERNIMVGLVWNYAGTGWADRKVPKYAQGVAQEVGETEDYANATEFDKTEEASLSPIEIMEQFILSDRRIETDPDNARMDAGDELGNAIATKIDTDIAGNFSSFNTDKGAGAGSAATIATAAAAIAVLRNNKTPGPINAVWHPYHWHDIWVELGQPAADQAFLGDVANEALREYYVGDFLAARHFLNANIAVDGDDDAVSGIFNRGALAFDVRRAPRLEPERDASRRAWELNMTAGYAHGVRRDAYGVGYTADATEPS